MTDTKQGGKGPSSAVVESIAGFSAGTLGNLVGHPFEVIKTRLQIDQGKVGAVNWLSIARGLLQSDRPITTVYRGLNPNLVGGSISWGLFFATKSSTEQFLATFKTKFTSNSPSSASTRAQLNPADYFISATVAGAVTQILTNPIWVIKTRMMSSNLNSADAFPSMSDGAVRVYRKEGLRGFYSGLTMSIVGVSQGAVQFAIYDPIKNLYLARQRRAAQHDTSDSGSGSNEKLGFLDTMIISTASKLIAQAALYPYQVVRSRLQNQNAEVRFGKGVRGVARNLWREAGIRGFYRGLGITSARTLPSTWTTFLVYENVKYYLPRYMSGDQDRVL